MEAERLDRIAKRLGSGVHRRHILGVLAAGLAAARGGQRVTLANHKPSHCAHEGEKVESGKSGKACCEGLTEDAEGRCVLAAPPSECPTSSDICLILDECGSHGETLPSGAPRVCNCGLTMEGAGFCADLTAGCGPTPTIGLPCNSSTDCVLVPGGACVDVSSQPCCLHHPDDPPGACLPPC
jgi:hypothetical protein